MNETGRILQDRYRIRQQIGQGGMGAVYVATDERFGSTVAIKETLCMDDSYRKAIEREARLLNSLKHTALPKVSDHFVEDNGQFLVMEYIPGEDLAFQMEQEGARFEVSQVLKWADQLLDALEYLHNQEHPVIHRDIKPQNLKITSKGQIVLLDFGLAKGSPAESPNQTAGKSIFGYTRNYASLEQIQGTGTDPRSDLYSLAATLYHLLTGVPPEDALTRAMAVLSQHDDPLVPANSLRSDIPKGLAGVLHRTLDLNAGQRPSTAAEMRQMLLDYTEYAHFADVVTVAAARVEHAAAGQPTKLMPVATRIEGGKDTDVQTQLLHQGVAPAQTAIRSGNSGEVLQLRSAAGRRRPARRIFAVAASFAGVLFAGSIVAGVYMYETDTLGAENALPLEPAPVVDPLVPELLVAELAMEEPQAPQTEWTPAQSPAADSAKRNETARAKDTAARQRAGAHNVQPPVPPNPDIRIKGDTVYMGNMVITDSRIETPEFYMDENGIKRKIPTPPRADAYRFPFTAEQLRKLTPEQRRKLRVVWRNEYNKATAVKPSPVPSPE